MGNTETDLGYIAGKAPLGPPRRGGWGECSVTRLLTFVLEPQPNFGQQAQTKLLDLREIRFWAGGLWHRAMAEPQSGKHNNNKKLGVRPFAEIFPFADSNNPSSRKSFGLRTEIGHVL